MKPALLITLEYPPQTGGIATYLSRLVDCFPAGQIQVLAQAPPADLETLTHERDMLSAAPIYRRPLLSGKVRPRWLPAVYYTDWLRRKEGAPSLTVVSHLLPLGLLARSAKRRHRTPYVVILHGMDAALALQAGGRKRQQAAGVIAEAELVVVNSCYTATLAQSLGATAHQIMICHPSPGFPANYQPQADSQQHLAELLGSSSAYTVMTAGRLVARKGFDDVLRAVAELKLQGRTLRYLIVGDGPERAALETQAAQLGLKDQVIFTGELTDDKLAAAYQASDVMVMPPRGLGPDVEGFGIVYLEANLFGKPVIGSRSGGVPDAVVHEQTGLLVEPNRPAELSAAIARLMDDRDFAARLGAAGQQRTVRDFLPVDQFRPLVQFARTYIEETVTV
jgi:phosphatidylinositol alpha-1,6-mannosyltransferase